MAVSAATSLRWNALSLPFQLARTNGAIGVPAADDLQPVVGLRLAQAVGATFLVVAPGGLVGLRPTASPCSLIATLASLQALLAITGICLACRFYGVAVWFDRRRSPQGTPPLATQRIRIQR